MNNNTPNKEQIDIHDIKRIKTEHGSQSKISSTVTNFSIDTNQLNDDDEEDMFGEDIEIEELDIATLIAARERKKAEAEHDISNDSFGDDIPFAELNDLIAMTENTTAAANTTSVATIDTSNFISNKSIIPSPVVQQKQQSRKKFTRYLVSSMTARSYTESEIRYSEKVLTLLQEDDNCAITAHLRQDWERTVVLVGDVVHIPTTTTGTKEIIIDNLKNFIVVHPDRLISCTAVADSYACLRKSVLQQKVRGVSEYTEALVHGNIVHSVLQNALQTGHFSVTSIKEEMARVVKNSIEDLYALDQDESVALSILEGYAGSIHEFGTKFVGSYPKPYAQPATDMGPDATKEMQFKSVSICKVLDIEEHLWSPTYGLKGMVDASVQIRLAPSNRVLVVPFELKTGKPSRYLTNRAQTILYTLLMSDRYDVEIGAGVLYYSKTNCLYMVPGSRNDLRSLIIARNFLAIAMNVKDSIPSMVKSIHTCQYCYVNDACLMHHKAIERGDGATSGLYQLFDDKTSHMTEATSSFFRHWWQLLDQEETDIDYIRKDIWSQPAEIREATGKCLANMKLNLPSCNVDPEEAKWNYSFTRHDGDRPLATQISPGDPIVVSSMNGHVNLAMGFVLYITMDEIMLSLTEPLRNPPQAGADFDPLNHQNFNSFIRYRSDVERFYSLMDLEYRIDRDEMSTGMGMLRNNLVMLTANYEDEAASSRNTTRLRELIIDLRKPDFLVDIPELPVMSGLNPDQAHALQRALQAKDYMLILGMPGTGKTMTTAAIIKHLVDQNKTVLVAAYTHMALDNVLLKVRESGVSVLRLGNADKVMPAMKDCVPSTNSTIETVADMKAFYDSKKVVGVTCLGIGHPLLQKREFDYCIIDEASQITLPTCIGPLRYAKTFVLVGDAYQLPPIVKNKEACEEGLSKSLFSILAEARPEAISYLEHQYRMNKEIMDIANLLIYDGKLKCGTAQVANKTLQVPRLEQGLKDIHSEGVTCKDLPNNCWLRNILDPKRKVVFVNTDNLSTKESRPFGSLLQNNAEAVLVYQTVETLLQCGIEEEQLAVISVYRSQLRLISQTLKARKRIEIATIDKYQGRDKECVILSLVRNNAQGNSGDLLRDWRRLNVAITRAKSKLILFGSVSTLASSALYSHILELFEDRKWVYDIPCESEIMHKIEGKSENLPAAATKRENKAHKTFRTTHAILKKNEVLKDIYHNSQ